MNHNVGDTVRIQSREWIDALERDNAGDSIGPEKEDHWFLREMLPYCGKIAKIMEVRTYCYLLDIDDGYSTWEDWMFDPDYRPDESLSPEDAIRAMLDGETLWDDAGRKYTLNKLRGGFIRMGTVDGSVTIIKNFEGLRRRPEKRKRLMTNWEVLAWASSADSHGWVVQQEGDSVWKAPQYFAYTLEEDRYRRARLLPDLSGVDPDTVQGFEAEE